MAPRVRESAEGREALEHVIDLNRREAHRRLDEIRASMPKDLATCFRVVVAADVAAAIDSVANAGNVDLTILRAWLVGAGGPAARPIAEALLPG